MKNTKKKSENPIAEAKKQSDVELAGLSGKVKQDKLCCYKAHKIAKIVIQGKIEVDSVFSKTNYITTYNEKGAKTQEQLFGRSEYDINIYNDKGYKTETVNYNMDGSIKRKTSIKYNDKGNPIEYLSYKADGSLSSKSTHIYNNDGKIIEYLSSDGNESNNKRVIYTYNEQGNPLTQIGYNSDGNIEYQHCTKYDEKGFKIEQFTKHTEKKAQQYDTKYKYKNNEYGDCIEMIRYNIDGSKEQTHTFTPEYDSEGKRIVLDTSPFREKKPAWETDEIENDAHGNWIKRTVFYHKIPQNIYIREITYFGEVGPNAQPLIHPLTCVKEKEKEVEDKFEPEEELPIEQAQWLVETTTTDNFPVLRYYALLYKEPPSLLTYTGPYIEVIALLNELKENMSAEMVNSYSTNWGGQGEIFVRYTLNFPYRGYIVYAPSITPHDADDFDIPGFFSDINDFDGVNIFFSQIQLLRPSDASGKRDEYFEEELEEYINKCMLQKTPDKPVINMIETTSNGFTIKEHAVDDNFEIKDLDINYGYGFSKFHNELMQRFNNATKGLVLFHGIPGTGKTYYIRHLLRKMAANKKVVIYMPPNMVDHLVEPAFMTFISRRIKSWASDGNFCVLLIEDAEPLLARRQEGVRIQGITNLLNMSDGILNDMLNLQIICTFNVDLKKLDNALLRPGRLIARKEFKPLSEIDANVLAQRLGIKHHFTSPVALGEIYSMLENKNTLIHDVDPDKNATSLIDDL